MSRLDDENEEKLEDGTCKELGSVAATATCGELSAASSNLMFMFSSPRGHPFGIKSSCRAICYQYDPQKSHGKDQQKHLKQDFKDQKPMEFIQIIVITQKNLQALS